jgi:hypothetical protein
VYRVFQLPNTRYKWNGFLYTNGYKLFYEVWLQEYTSVSKFYIFLSWFGNIINLNEFLETIGFSPNFYYKHNTYLSLIFKNLIYGHIECWKPHSLHVGHKNLNICILFVYVL